jgi:tRNA threonylcarbamoyladenosine biosynthesis protein TsaE
MAKAGAAASAGAAAEAGRTLALADLAATRWLGASLAAAAQQGDVLALSGELGAGKTAFARAFIQALGGSEEVPSPTFTLCQVYELSPAPVWHFDLYRIARPADALELGLEEALAEGISLIEWPERLGPLLPAERLGLRFAFAEDEAVRIVTMTAHGPAAARLAESVP